MKLRILLVVFEPISLPHSSESSFSAAHRELFRFCTTKTHSSHR